MQEIHPIGGGSRLFSAGGGDRRLRPNNHQNHQALKCPRCESLNTKFCYYNNYNLSQPRHFCKSCRRYWTKGGVLRNVPVGGGCRKTKRSKPKKTNSTADITTTATSATAATTLNRRPPSEQHQLLEQEQRERKSSNSHSSSESSSLTATNTTAAGNTALEVISAHSSSSASNNLFNGINESKLFGHNNMNSSFQGGSQEQGSDCGIFSDIGTFTSLINSTNDHLGFGFGNIMSHHGLEQVQHDQNQQWQPPPTQKMDKEDMKLHESMPGGFIDHTVHVELPALQSSSRTGNGGFGTLEWQGTGDHGLFDLPNAVDQSYWNQSQWSDQDQPNLYLP